jgi:hypothetical protein
VPLAPRCSVERCFCRCVVYLFFFALPFDFFVLFTLEPFKFLRFVADALDFDFWLTIVTPTADSDICWQGKGKKAEGKWGG